MRAMQSARKVIGVVDLGVRKIPALAFASREPLSDVGSESISQLLF
jgi:hypothetical protein